MASDRVMTARLRSENLSHSDCAFAAAFGPGGGATAAAIVPVGRLAKKPNMLPACVLSVIVTRFGWDLPSPELAPPAGSRSPSMARPLDVPPR